MSEREELERAMATLVGQRTALGDAAVEAALAGLRQKLAALDEGRPATSPLAGERPHLEKAERIFAETGAELDLARTKKRLEGKTPGNEGEPSSTDPGRGVVLTTRRRRDY